MSTELETGDRARSFTARGTELVAAVLIRQGSGRRTRDSLIIRE